MILGPYAREGEVIAARLAEAVREDGTGDFRDEALIELLDSIRAAGDSFDRLKLAAILLGLARRIESSGAEYPNLIQTAAELSESPNGSEHERALYVSKTIIRPLADGYMRAE
jgi:hypothetical protein